MGSMGLLREEVVWQKEYGIFLKLRETKLNSLNSANPSNSLNFSKYSEERVPSALGVPIEVHFSISYNRENLENL